MPNLFTDINILLKTICKTGNNSFYLLLLESENKNLLSIRKNQTDFMEHFLLCFLFSHKFNIRMLRNKFSLKCSTYTNISCYFFSLLVIPSPYNCVFLVFLFIIMTLKKANDIKAQFIKNEEH